MSEEVFADTIADISFAGGVFRIDFVSLSPRERDANGNPTLVFRQRVIMPPDGFINAFNAMQELMGKLAEAGVVKRNPPQPLSSSSAEPPKPASPNF